VAAEQVAVDHPAAAEGAEVALARDELAQQRLHRVDLALGFLRVVAYAERRRVGQAVVAEPMALSDRALGKCARARAAQLLADHEEAGADPALREQVEHLPGHARGPVVEAQRHPLDTSLTSPARGLLVDDRDRGGQVIANHRVHLVLELVEARHRPPGQDLGELGEIAAPHLEAVGLGGEVALHQLHGLLVGQIPEVRRVVVDQRGDSIADRVELFLVLVVQRPEGLGLLFAQPRLRR
jgi:hypothetical protein